MVTALHVCMTTLSARSSAMLLSVLLCNLHNSFGTTDEYTSPPEHLILLVWVLGCATDGTHTRTVALVLVTITMHV